MHITSRGDRGAIWILQESPMEAETTRRALASHHDVEILASEMNLFERLGGDSPADVLIVDWTLRSSSAASICRAIRERKSEGELPILIVCQSTERDSVLEVASVGLSDTITRPLDARELSARVNNLVRLAHARRDAERERTELLERERAARAAAEEANRAKDEFLAILSHELRTPLNAIVGWVKLMRQGTMPAERQASALEKIERNALAQAQLIEDLLDISRIISGKMTLTMTDLDVAAAARASVAAVELTAQRKGVVLDVACEEGVVIAGDAARVQQIVWNLLSNALRFTPTGGCVSLMVERRGDFAHVEVADTGGGIEPALLPHLFERFTQGTSNKARSHGGLGLGLSIVRHLAELHGATVAATSDGIGKGATFVVRFPLAEHARHQAEDEGDSSEHPAMRLEGARLMVIDDEPDARELLKDLLEPLGAVVDIAGSADEAFARLQGQRYTAIISDVGMPDADGNSLIRRLRQLDEYRSVPAIALSAYAAAKDRDEALLAGFDAHLKKPLDMIELLGTLTALMARGGGGLERDCA